MRKPVSPYAQEYIMIFKMAAAIISFICLWGSLALITLLRSQSSGIAGGGEFSDNKWGFGQIAAVVAWLPTFVEVVRVFGKLNPFAQLGYVLVVANLISCHCFRENN